jgi:DNA-binding transcriptional MerR regulator
MPNYRPLAIAAENLRTTEQTLLEFNRSGWIDVAVKDGQMFLSAHDIYRARFILHLQRKLGLTSEQISAVLLHEKPPYSLDRVGSILERLTGAKQP